MDAQQHDGLEVFTVTGFRDGYIACLTLSRDPKANAPGSPPVGLEAVVYFRRSRAPEESIGYECRVWFETRHGRREVRQVMLAAAQSDKLPRGGITWRTLRAVPIDEIQREADALIARLEDSAPRTSDLLGGLRARPGRRQQHDDRALAQLAGEYVKLAHAHAPVQQLAREHHYSPSRVRDLLHMARGRGLLEGSGRGRAGGRLTPKARALLHEPETH